MTAWRITLVEQPSLPNVPGKAPRPDGLWDFVAEEPGVFLGGFGAGDLRQDVRRFEGTAESRDAAYAKATYEIDRELERRARFEVVFYPAEPEEAPDGA